ncbi:hypothetical protein RR46_03493 [Papilio xuthus]|uniref:Uncharacterized protein n=1 Tax=Papilio xuthus TaxID=66420 RepID=A0A194QD91_PAPXU|nr:hypothetical protein RR46_03493 [Papilio xuthus]
MNKQLLLFHNAVSAYFSGNNVALEAAVRHFSVPGAPHAAPHAAPHTAPHAAPLYPGAPQPPLSPPAVAPAPPPS